MNVSKCCILVAGVLFFFMLSTPQSFSADPTPPIGQSGAGSDIPTGQSSGQTVSEEGIDSDIFGQRGGRYHPFVVVQSVYTDNLFDTNTNTEDDFITSVAPGIWLAFPANRERLLKLNTTTTAAGGMQLSRVKSEATRRYQTYFLYSPEFIFYADNSQHDHVNHKAEALFQYNFQSGFSIDVIDLFNDREEIAGNGVSDTLFRHQDNLVDLILAYQTRSEKLKVQLNYSNYYLDYKDDPVTYRNRMDNTVGISTFYKFWPKTALFLEYNYSIIEFDTSSTFDNVEHRYYGGVTWDITAKTKGTVKVGYTDKDFDSDSVSDQDDYSLEVQTQHNLTAKRALQINGYRKFHESDAVGASSFLSTGVDIGLFQRFTEKWSGTFKVFYEMNEYNDIVRDDDYYGFSPAIRFKPKQWLFFDLGYYYYKNDSNSSTFDYETNRVLFRITASM